MLKSETVKKYDTYKDSGIEWIGEIPQEWKFAKLAWCSNFVNGYAFNSENMDIEGEVPVVRIGDIQNNQVQYETCLKVDSSEELKPYELKVNDIVIAMSGATTGKLAVIYDEKQAYINQRVGIIRSKYNKFIRYCLDNESFMQYVALLSAGSAQPNISMGNILDYKIPYISIEEQQQIAEYLDKKCGEIDRVVETEKTVIEKLKEYKQSIITEAVTKGLDKSAPLKDSGIEWIGKIPQHWEVRKLKTIGDYRNGLTYSPEDICEEENGTLVLRSSNIKSGKLVLNDNVYVSSEIPNVLRVQKGDILVCSRNGSRDLIGKNAIIDTDINASFGAFMMILRCSCSRYMYYILNSHIFNYYLGSFFTSTINQLTGKNFGGMDIVFCSDEKEQEQIVEHLDKKCSEIDKAIADKEQVIEKFTEYKKSLIYECVTGKRKVV